jgi:glucose-1-phosphate thymidylyltransferase
MKGIILAGGAGTRLYPATKGISKQLLPVYDKPMIYYPLSVLMLADIKDVLIITTPEDQDGFRRMLGDGSEYGINLSYKTQEHPRGLADAFIIGAEFIGDDCVCLVLGDNIFYGQSFSKMLTSAVEKAQNGMASVFGYPVNDPERFGVVEFDANNKAVSIEEKPLEAKSKYAVTGLYFYPNSVIDIAKDVRPSDRGEIEITCINNSYLNQDKLYVEVLGRGFAWLDTGTHESLIEAGQFVHTVERRQGLKIACIEEIAYRKGWISSKQLTEQAELMRKNEYGQYLLSIAGGDKK